jgi:hypothetical protein
VPGPESDPGAIPGAGIGTNPPSGQSGDDGGEKGRGPFGTPKPTAGSGNTGDGKEGGNTSLTGDSPAEQQRISALFAYHPAQDEDAELEKPARAKKLKNETAVFIRDGGISIPGETRTEN